MAALVQPPIFVMDREGSLHVFDSVASAENDLEVNDVDADEYVGLDAAGRPLLLTVIEGERTGRWWWARPGDSVRIDASSASPQPELLRRVLVEALEPDPVLGDEPLDSLITRARTGKDLMASQIIGEVRVALSS